MTPRRFPAATDAAPFSRGDRRRAFALQIPTPTRARRTPENIDGGIHAAFDAGDPETREAVVDALGDMCWRKAHDGRDTFICLVRTILTRNTSDVASHPAFDALVERYDGETDLGATLAGTDRKRLTETVESAGLYNQKSRMIVESVEEVVPDVGDAEAFDRFVRESDPDEVRERLLSIRGVGPKTADCVLLFSGGRGGVFPVDTHVLRVAVGWDSHRPTRTTRRFGRPSKRRCRPKSVASGTPR